MCSILKPLNDDFTSAIDNTTTLTNRVGAFGRSLKDIRAVYSVEGWSGVKNMFANTSESIVTSRDIDMLKSYNAEVAAGVDPTVALKNNMIGASKGAISLAEKAGKAGVDIQSLKVSADSASTSLMGARIAATAFNMAITMGISIAITKIIELCSWLANLHDTQQKNAEDEAANAQQKATDANNELKDIQSLIDKYKELAAKGKVSFSDRDKAREIQEKITKLVGDQADNLDLVNGKLDEQLKKLNAIYDTAQENTTSSYRRAYSKSLDSVTSSQYGDWNWVQKLANDWGGSSGNSIYIADAYTESTFNDTVKRINDMYAKLAIQDAEANGTFNDFILRLPEKLGDRIDALDAAIKAMEEQPDYKDNKIWQRLNDYREEMYGKIHSTENSMIDLVNNLTQTSVKDDDGADFKSVDDYIAYRDNIIKEITSDTDVKDAIDRGLLSTETVTKQVDMYLSTLDQFETYYNEWYQKFGSDTIKGIKDIKSQFNKNVGANGSILFPYLSQPLLSETNGQAPNLLIPEITPEQADALKTAKEFSDWIDNLSSKDKDLVYKISLDKDTAEWDLNEWQKHLDIARQSAIEAGTYTAISLSSILSEKSDGEEESFSDRIKTYTDSVSELQESLESFKSGSFTNDDFLSLVNTYPQLAGRASDLDAAITELLDDMDSTMVSDFDSQFGKLDTQEDIDALKEYESQVLSTRETAAKFQSDIENLVSVFGTVKSAVEEYNENGFLSLSSLQSILSLNDKYISALTNEQGALDLSTESYKKLVEAELIELKAQTLQNSLDTVRNIDNRTEALAYLNEREHSAAQASLDLADAQWQEALSAAAVKDIQQGTGDLYQRTVIAARKAYDTRIALIDEYAKTAFTIGELSTATDEYSKALNNEKEALENSKKALEDQKNALEETKQGYEDALSAVKDLVSWVQDYIKQIKNDEIDALQKKKESIDKLIESQKELLDAEKEEYEWNKTIAEKQNTVAKDTLAASIASLDDSSAGRKAQKQANDKLAESRTDMQDALYEHEIEQRKEALDKLKEEQDEYYDNLIKEIQDYLGNEVQLYKDACSMIDNDSGDLYGKLLWYCRNYTTTTEAEFNHMWNSAQSAMEQYNAANLGTFELLNNLQGRIYEVDGAIDAITQSISSYESAIDGVQSKLDGLSKQAQRTIADIRAATNAEDEWSKPKWVYTWQGNDYTSFMSNRDAAIQDIIRKIEGQYGGVFPASASTIYGTIRKYASGTNSATGGLSLVGERGAELRVLNSGDGILKNQIVRGLTSLGANPAQFIADAGQMLMKNLFGNRATPAFGAIGNNNQIAPNIVVTIQGDATQSTVDALKAQAKKIMNDTIKTIRSDTLMKTYSSRVR